MTDMDYNSAQLSMSNEHYPGLFQGADAVSVSAQKTYFLLQWAHLGSLVLGSVVAASTVLAPGMMHAWLYAASAIVLALGLLIFWIGRSRQDDKAWFDCRAIAESVKTVTWRFMMRVPPFESEDRVGERFVAALREIRQAIPGAEAHLVGAEGADACPITDFMRQARSLPVGERKQFYIENRLRNQKSWYSRKGSVNASYGVRWFWTTACLQALAITIAIIQAAAGGLGFNLVPILTTCAAAVAAWNQMKRHDELKKTYALASQELAELEAIASGLTTDSVFPQLVEQVEEAVSREHTMWCARRDVPLRRNNLRTW
jgi:hypothetical protein